MSKNHIKSVFLPDYFIFQSMKQFFITTLVMLCSCLQAISQNDTIPFLFRGHLYFQASINDTLNGNIVYDTGGSDIFGVDSVFFAHSFWEPQHLGSAFAPGAAGVTTIPLIMDATRVTVGNEQISYDYVPIYQLRDIVGCHCDGLMGIKGIADQPLEINFEKSILVKHKNGLPDIKGYKRVPIHHDNNRIYIQAEVNIGGTLVSGWYIMDTGSGGSITYTSKAAEEYHLHSLPGKRELTDHLHFGIGDKQQELSVAMMPDWIVIGSDTIRGRTIDYVPDGAGAFSERAYAGVIGNTIWSKFNILIDTENEALYLRRFKEDTPPIPSYDYYFTNRTDIGKGWIVSTLVREGDAALAGIALGDIILSVNGKNVEDYSWEEEWHVDEVPQQELTIIGPDNKEKKIRLKAKNRW